MNIDWQQIITALGGYTVFAAAMAWLVQTVIAHVLSKDIERYKTKLDAEAKIHQKELELNLQSQFDIALAKANSEFQIKAKENEIRFSKLHEKRADVISNFYTMLNAVYPKNALLILKIERKPSENHIKNARELWVECGNLTEYFRKNKLYFSKNLADEIEKFISILSQPADSYVDFTLSDAPDKDVLAILKEWKTKNKDERRIRKLLETEFREILGSEEHIQNP